MVFKCKMCGGDIEPIAGTNTGKCLYCKSVMTLPNLDNEKIVNLYNRANKLRLANEFDKAYATYESILEIDNDQVEAHWGLILCKYGVEYVDDPRTKKKVPTCHRANYDSVLADPDYVFVKEKAYGEALKIYEEEAKKINHIQKGILDISSKEEPYDIFICYKETDKDGERTEDSVLAQDIYDALVKEGYKVFFSRITLEEKLGSEYEPYIFAALNSAKVMLVVGTSLENMESIWVKNEWSRYLEFMKSDKSKSLIPVYKKIDAYDLPESFSMLQAQSMDKIGAMQDLVRGIGKLISASKKVNKDELDQGTAKKVQDVLDGATSLGNNRYEVTVVKEKRATWYYIFLLTLASTQMSMKGTVIYESFAIDLFNISEFSSFLGKIGLESLSIILVIFQVICCLLFLVVCFIKMRSRKLMKKANYLILGILILEFLTVELALRYVSVAGLIYWFSVFLTFVLLFVNSKWQLDTSTKTIVEGDEKNQLLKKNKDIRENFKRKDNFPFKKNIFIGGIVLCMIIYGITAYNSVFRLHGNARDESKKQFEIITPYVRIRKDSSTSSPAIGIAKSGEIYTILATDNISRGNCNVWYRVKQDNGVIGYICGITAYVKILDNQSNEKDYKVSQLEVINDFIRIRDEASLQGDALGQVTKGEIYTILEDKKQSNGSHWYKIQTRYGIIGYIYSGDHNEYVKVYNAK